MANNPQMPNSSNDDSSIDKDFSDKEKELELQNKADNGELTEEDLKDYLNKYAKALAEEFESKTAEEPENVELHTRNFFKKNVHTAAAQIVWLANNADSESVRLSAAKHVVAVAIDAEVQAADPISDLIKQLQAKPGPKQLKTADTAGNTDTTKLED